MQSIQTLDTYKVLNVKFLKLDTKEGTIENITLDGTRYGIYTFVDRVYKLTLEYLTEAELKAIEKEYTNLIIGGQKASFPINWLKIFEFVTSSTNTNIEFIIKSNGFKESKMKLPGYFSATIELTERVVIT